MKNNDHDIPSKNNQKQPEISNLATDNASSLRGDGTSSNIELIGYTARSISPMLENVEIKKEESFDKKLKNLNEQTRGSNII